ncbi:MAG: lamin tail domain-containing protein [Phycisphaerae bacterium]|nr:lamin tail domain-containing protein [Phycisphaerae bacterium]
MRNRYALVVAVTVAATTLSSRPAGAQGWPAVFDPLQVLTLNLDMDPADWMVVQNDETLSIEVQAWFWADGEDPILISVRRKSGDPLTEAPGFVKVSLKLDINEHVTEQSWHDLRKLSLENGDDQDVVSEGFAWQLHRLASGTQGYGYRAAFASWVRLCINGVYTGVYVSTEQRDRRFLENRGLYTEGETWLYKVSDVDGQELKVGGPGDSPTVQALCYSPFAPDPTCPTPDDNTLAAELPTYINMAGILTLLAGNAFTGNPDAMLSHGKNFHFADFLQGRTRMYFPWDLDSVLSNNAINGDIYAGQSNYAMLLNVPAFREQYSRIVNDLVCSRWSQASLIGFLDALEPVLNQALEQDLNNQFDGTVAEHFEGIRNWVSQRVANVTGQIEGYQPCPSIYVTINEFMADNFGTIEDPDEPGEYADWIELHNPNATPVDLGGVYLTDDLADPTKYQIPAGVSIPAGGYLIFWADDDGTQGPLHTNFKLSAGGEAVGVFDPNGVTEIDSIVFEAQMPDVSYGRYPDGTGSWGFMATPTPDGPNSPHNAPPSITGTTRTPVLPTAADTVWVTSTVTDMDGTVADVTLTYDAGGGAVDVTMYDDGAHEDGTAGDDMYGGLIPAFSQGTVVNYYLSTTDDLGAESTDPLGAPVSAYSYSVGYAPPLLYINEFMASNTAAYEDPENPGDFDDWIEIYNAESVAVDLGGMYLTDDLAIPTRWQVPAGVSIPAGGYLIFWADNEPLQGDTHTSFKLSAGGEQIGLFDTDANGNMAIDTLSFGVQSTDVSMGRFPDGVGSWLFFTEATPGAFNGILHDYEPDGDVDLDDFQQFATCMTGPGGGASGCEVFDSDRDGDVDLIDFASFQRSVTW